MKIQLCKPRKVHNKVSPYNTSSKESNYDSVSQHTLLVWLILL